MELFDRNIEHLCRVCLLELPKDFKGCVDFENLLIEPHNVSYSEAFVKTTGNPILAHEPRMFCKRCSEMIIVSYELREKAAKTQVVLNELRPKIEVALIKVEPDIECTNNDDSDLDLDNDRNSDPDFDLDKELGIDLEQNPNAKECHICKHRFKNQAILNQHFRKQHPEDLPFECPYCHKRYLAERKCDIHVGSCPKGPKTAIKKRIKKKFVCPICGILASTDHTKSHSTTVDKKPSTSQSYVCDLCGVLTSSRASIANHMRNQHLNIRMKCKHCQAYFRKASALQRHMLQNHPDKAKKLRCRLCDFTSMRLTELRRHRFIHSGKKLSKCQICGAEFTTNCKLQTHLASHSDARPFTCEICGSAFKTKKGLQAHNKTHKAYEYECPVCQRAYLTNQLMRNHAVKNHPEYQMPPPGTVFNKNWLMKRTEQQLQEIAMGKGIKTEELPVQELPQVQYYQPYFRS